MHQTKDYFISAKQDKTVPNTNNGRGSTSSSPSSTGKPTAVWESPEFEEFDLCMEVTAYVHQWE